MNLTISPNSSTKMNTRKRRALTPTPISKERLVPIVPPSICRATTPNPPRTCTPCKPKSSAKKHSETICVKYFLSKGQCGFGDKCKYLHLLPEEVTPAMSEKVELCPDFAKSGFCSNKGCQLRHNHINDEVDPNDTRKLCFEYANKGTCAFGRYCSYRHVQRVCFSFANTGKCTRRNCKYLHSRDERHKICPLKNRCPNKYTCKFQHPKAKSPLPSLAPVSSERSNSNNTVSSDGTSVYPMDTSSRIAAPFIPNNRPTLNSSPTHSNNSMIHNNRPTLGNSPIHSNNSLYAPQAQAQPSATPPLVYYTPGGYPMIMTTAGAATSDHPVYEPTQQPVYVQQAAYTMQQCVVQQPVGVYPPVGNLKGSTPMPMQTTPSPQPQVFVPPGYQQEPTQTFYYVQNSPQPQQPEPQQYIQVPTNGCGIQAGLVYQQTPYFQGTPEASAHSPTANDVYAQNFGTPLPQTPPQVHQLPARPQVYLY